MYNMFSGFVNCVIVKSSVLSYGVCKIKSYHNEFLVTDAFFFVNDEVASVIINQFVAVETVN